MNLFKAISYKEWIKTRKIFGVLFILSVAVLAYSFIEMTHSIRLNGAVNVWYGLLYMDGALPEISLNFPLIAGLSLALVQFVPEMTNKRLKLTLHLPAKESAIVASMLLFGYFLLVLFLVFTAFTYIVGFSFLFPSEIVCVLMSKLVPSMVAGFVAYGLTAWVCFEPQWKQRVLNLMVAVTLLAVLYASPVSGAYAHFWVGHLVLLVASFAFPFYSVLRFKHGVL